jgi:hypothetical protein
MLLAAVYRCDAADGTRRGDVNEAEIGEMGDRAEGSTMDGELLGRQRRKSQRLHLLASVHPITSQE